jgi:integrase
VKLIQANIATLTLPPDKTDWIVFDDDIPGFGIRLRTRRTSTADCPSICSSWIFQYRVGAKQYRQGLGSAKVIPAAVARAGAAKLYARVKLDENPQAERQAKRRQSALTLAAAVGAYLEARQADLSPASYRVTKLYLTGPYFQPLHAMGLGDIRHPDIAARLTAIGRAHSSNTAGAARCALSTLYKWTIEEGWATANPVIGTRKPAVPKGRDRVLTMSELVAVWHACNGGSDFDLIVRLLMLLACRRSEIGGAVWGEFDLDGGSWTLPKERTKNGHEHFLVLPPTALQIIRGVVQSERAHLFGDRSPIGFSLWTEGKRELDRRLGDTVKPFRLHDLRRSAATHMAGDVGIDPHIIEAILNHYGGHRRGVAGIYNRSSYERAVGAALARWSEHLIALVEGRESNVVPLRSA